MEGGVGVTLEPPVEALDRLPRPSPVHVFLATFLPAVAAVLYLMMRPCSVYLVNYSCFHTNPSHRVSLDTFLEHAKLVIFIEGAFIDERNVRLMTRLLERFGLGKETCVPPAHHFVLPYRNLEASTGISPDAIDFLVVNCSLFVPIPFFTDMIIHKYKIRNDICYVHLSGMGCSAGVVVRIRFEGSSLCLDPNL
ncbi:3-ketoacyl-CoA synthase 5-like [Aegilops tauschii subsp. strangulata]|uniref:3-ketoacyl-CoA synthase 5-like n=1 Tax=Aegilops tauschii subsp. strangulata TaxID=200361 RepID=UPI000989D8D2|nr:3-ketoacyl-CoA synthase 5-like [Aegilops tauschii subsp. strangulata]